MVAKRERLAKFMYDLTCDQETKQMLLTEADYSAACAVKEEITTLQPPCEEQTRTQLLNEWNTQSSDEEEDQGGFVDANNLEHGDSAQKENSSDSSDEECDSGTPRHQETGVQVSFKDVCKDTSGKGKSASDDTVEVADKYNETWNVGCRKKLSVSYSTYNVVCKSPDDV